MTMRWKVVVLLTIMTALAYVQRLSLSAVATDVSRELHLSKETLGYVFSMFTLFYALFEIPGGLLGDRFGTRRTLTWLVAAWSLCTMASAAAEGLASLIVWRSLLGATEAGTFPNAARALSRWVPSSERGRALGLTFLGLSVGAAVTTPLLLALAVACGWRLALVAAAIPGIIWAAVWYWLVRDAPPDLGASEPRGSDANLLRVLSRNSNLWRVCGVYFAFGYGIYFYITWMPTYLREARQFSIGATGTWSALLWMSGGAGYLIGGYATDSLLRRYGSMRIARCGLGAAAYAASAFSLLVVAATPVAWVAAAALSAAALFQFAAAPAIWSVCLDIGRERPGSVTGFMNMVGNIGGTLAPLVVGFSVHRLSSWTIPFVTTAIVFAFGITMWLMVDVAKKIEFAHR